MHFRDNVIILFQTHDEDATELFIIYSQFESILRHLSTLGDSGYFTQRQPGTAKYSASRQQADSVLLPELLIKSYDL